MHKDKDEEWGNIELPGLSDDKLLNTNWNRVSANREHWKKISTEKRKEFGKKITQSKLTITPEQANEIWFKLWGEDRGQPLYKKLAKEYNVAYDAVFMLALGDHPLCPVKKDQWKLIHQEWHNRYGYNKHVYIIRSPGNDLLDYYDQMNQIRGAKTSKLAPSELFDIRFKKNKDKAYIKELLNTKGIKVDNNMINGYANNIMKWIVDKPHQEWEFDSLVTMSEWISNKFNRPYKKGGQLAESCIKAGMIWSDKGYGMNGWSFIKIPKA